MNPSYNFLYVLPPARTATKVFLCVSQLLWSRSILDHSLQTLDIVHENAREKHTKKQFLKYLNQPFWHNNSLNNTSKVT